MRENIMRKEAQQNGGTFHLMQHQQQSSGSSYIEEYGTPIQTARDHEAGMEAETAMRAQTEQERREQTQQSFGQRLKENTATLLSTFIPRRPENFNIGTESHTISSDEEFADVARASQEPPSMPAPPARYRTQIDYTDNINFWKTRSNITERDIKFQFFYVV